MFAKFGAESAANVGVHPSEQSYADVHPPTQVELTDIAEQPAHRARRTLEGLEQSRKVALRPGVGDTMRASEVKANRGTGLAQAFSRFGAKSVKPPMSPQLSQALSGMVQLFGQRRTPYVAGMSGTPLPLGLSPTTVLPRLVTPRLMERGTLGSPSPSIGDIK